MLLKLLSSFLPPEAAGWGIRWRSVGGFFQKWSCCPHINHEKKKEGRPTEHFKAHECLHLPFDVVPFALLHYYDEGPDSAHLPRATSESGPMQANHVPVSFASSAAATPSDLCCRRAESRPPCPVDLLFTLHRSCTVKIKPHACGPDPPNGAARRPHPLRTMGGPQRVNPFF